MKLKALMIASLFAVSASANAGAPGGYTIHKVDNLKLKVKAADVDGKGVTETVKDKDIVDLLCETTPDKAELVVLAPCPVEAPEGSVYGTVWDKNAEDFASSCGLEACDYYAPVVETKNGAPKKAWGLIVCEVDGGEDGDAVIQKGVFKAGKVQGTTTEFFD